MSDEPSKKAKKAKKSKKGNKEKKSQKEIQDVLELDIGIQPDARLLRQFEEGAAGDFAKLLHHDWSLEEDKLIISGLYFDPVLSLKAIEKKYLLKQTKDPRRFNKNVTTEMLRTRSADLQQMPHRLSLLRKEIELEVYRAATAAVNAPTTTTTTAPPPATTTNEKTTDKSKQGNNDDKKEAEEVVEPPKITVVLSKHGHHPHYYTIDPAKLVAASSHLKSMIDNAFNVVKKGDLPTITLDPSTPQYNKTLEYGVLEPAIFELLLAFVEDPHVVIEQFDKTKKLEAAMASMEEISKSVEENIVSCRSKLLANVQTMCSSEERSMKESLEREFEAEIREIKIKHHRRVAEAVAAIQIKWTNLHDQLQTYFATEAERLRSIAESINQQNELQLANVIQTNKKKSDQIFTNDSTLKLGIMGELFEIENLKESVRLLVTNDIWRFAQNREWKCTVIRDTLTKNILVQLPLSSVVKLQELSSATPCGCSIDPNLIAREVKLRKMVLKDSMIAMDNAELRAAIDRGDCPFEDVLQMVIHHRTMGSAQDRICIDPENLPKYCKVDSLMMTVEATVPLRYVTVQASRGLKSGGWGRWFYEIHVKTLDTIAGATISVGYDAVRESSEGGKIPGLVANANGSFGCCYQNDGQLHRGGHGEFIDGGFGNGDYIGIGFDLQTHCTSFYVNGKKVIACAEYQNQGGGYGGGSYLMEGKNGEFKLGVSNYHIIPVCCLYSVRNDKLSCVSFNFQGPFHYLPPSYEPLARRE